MSHRVMTVLQHGYLLLDAAIPAHVFGYHGGERYHHEVVGPGRGMVRSSAGPSLTTDGGLDRLDEADTIVIAGYEDVRRRPPDRLLMRLRAAAARDVRLVSICTGAFTLAWAGLLDGRRATTHWSTCHVLAAMFPTVRVDPDVLYVDEDARLLTSAGVAAGLDLCLHIVRTDHGANAATEIARHTVIAPHRDGGQAQFINKPIPEQDDMRSLGAVCAWALDHLDERLDLPRLAARASMSVRSFTRHFRDETGTTPLQWVLAQRVARARQLLESTDLPVELIAHRCGFASGPHLRRHFARVTSTTPHAYRAAFSLQVR